MKVFPYLNTKQQLSTFKADRSLILSLYEPAHEILILMAKQCRKGSDMSGQMHSIALPLLLTYTKKTQPKI